MASAAAPIQTPKKEEISRKPYKRFACRDVDIEWTLTDADGINYVISQLLLNGASWLEMNQGIRKIQAIVNRSPNMEGVPHLLEQARRTNDVTPLLRAYTMDCDFYRTLNKTLAQRANTSNIGDPISSLLNLLKFDQDDETPTNDWVLYFVGPIFDDIFSKTDPRYQFIGQTYRGARISRSELRKYTIGILIFNKAFTSTSKKRHVAESFISPHQKQDNKLNALFIFTFSDTDTSFTIDLKDISVFSDEAEVLIMPGIPFRITKVQRGNPIEISLEQFTINHLLGKKKNN